MSAEPKVNETPAAPNGNNAVDNTEKLRKSTEATFEKVTAYLLGELNSCTEDYVLLEKMNEVTAKKYAEMAGNAENLTLFMKQLKEKYESFQPFLEKIDQVEVGVQSLEETVMQLDEYSKRLELKYRQLNSM